MDIPGYPNQPVGTQSEWTSLIDGWTALLECCILHQRFPPSLETFVTDYLRVMTLNQTVQRDMSDQKLRKAVYRCCMHSRVLDTAPIETLWDFLAVYGPTNVTHVSNYIAELDSVRPQLSFKLGKLTAHYISSGSRSESSIRAVVSTAVASGRLFVTDEWINKAALPQPLEVLSRQKPDPAIRQLHEMFGVSAARARRLLHAEGSAEAVISRLLEDPSYEPSAEAPEAQDRAKAKRVQVVFGKRQKTTSADTRAKSLQRALLALYDSEDEVDDTYDELDTLTAAEPASSAAVEKMERALWEAYNRDKSVLMQSGRKSKARADLKRLTAWSDEQIEGWARMLEKSPKRMHILEHKFAFRGNHGTGPRVLEGRNTGPGSGVETAETGVETAETGVETAAPPGASKGPRLVKTDGQKKRKEQNKARIGNHNRRAAHAKKLAG